MSHNYSNYTTYGIHNKAERYIWAMYMLFIILSSLIGDSLILVSSITYNAIKLHKFLIVIMQHLAVCDLISSVTVSYALISLLSNGNVLGSFLCYVRVYTVNYIPPVSYYLVAVLATSKLMVIKRPFRSIRWTPIRAHFICIMVWLACLSAPLMLLCKDKDDILFDYRLYVCSYAFSNPSHVSIRPLMVSLFLAVPCLIVVVTSVLLVTKAWRGARRHQKSLRWQGVLTVILTAVVCCVALLPYTIYVITKNFVHEDTPSFFHIYFYRFTSAVTELNLAANFYIYSLTNQGFREFLVSRVKMWRSLLPCSSQQSREGGSTVKPRSGKNKRRKKLAKNRVIEISVSAL